LIIFFHFHIDFMIDFIETNVEFISNSSINYCANNTLTHYTTKFPKITDLDGTWEIGLAEIQYPHSIWSCYRMGSTVLRFDRQVVNADYDNRVQDEYLTQKYDLRTRTIR
jgi:hypothetical protein